MDNWLGIDKETLEVKRMNKIAELYPLPRTSYSQLKSFLDCKYTFYMTYIEKNYDNANKYTQLGSLLHDIFERQGKQLLAENPFTQEAAMADFNKRYFADKEVEKRHFKDKEDYVAMYQKGVKAIVNYYAGYGDFTPLYLEKKFLDTIGDGIPPMTSYVDRIDGEADKPETWIITDYKSGGSPKSKDYLRKDFQLALYAAQVFKQYGKYPKALQFYHPVPDKFQTAIHKGEGVYEFTGQRAPVVTFSVADTIIQVRQIIADIVETVKTGNWTKTVDSWNCKMCFHYEKCQPFGGLGGWANV